MNIIRSLLPTTLKNKLFLSFLLLILLPFSILNLYNFHKIEEVMQHKIGEQSHEQLEAMIRELRDYMGISFNTLIMLEQDSTVLSILKEPDQYSALERKNKMEDKFKTINNSFFLLGPQLYYTVLDYKGNVYTSYQPFESLNYNDLTGTDWYKELDRSDTYRWVANQKNDVHPDYSRSPELLTLYSKLVDVYQRPYGVAKLSLDYSFWFKSVASNVSEHQDYFILTDQGQMVAQSNPDAVIPPASLNAMLENKSKGYVIDESTNSIINYSYIETTNWFMASRMTLDFLFQEIEGMKQRFFATMILMTLAFIAITYLVSSTITRPLQMLRLRMVEAVKRNMKVQLPTRKLKGEMLEITHAFNTMMGDMNDLIQRLKIEERQKEAVRFQMLLAQMNPHFLLNTLNTIKWLALRHNQPDISEISMSLGKLLETSLNVEVELIHFQDEIELVKAYAYIQNFRYNQQYRIEYVYSELLNYALVPKLSLQPLVENCIHHAFDTINHQGEITIRAYVNDDRLMLEVEDNGIGWEAASRKKKLRKRESIGITNIRERLNLLFKHRADMECLSTGQGALVRITLPLLLSKPFENAENEQKGEQPDVDGSDR